jgi:hypothetical protein
MAPSHLGEDTAEGVGFLVAGAAQLGLALWIAIRPNRRALWTTVVTTVALIGAWGVSRTVGLPLGDGGTEDVTVVDGICVALEAAAVLLAAFLLIFRTGTFLKSSAIAVMGVIGALALTGGALASPAARDHAAGGHHGDEAAADDGHGHGAAAEDDRGFAELQNGQMGSHEHEPGAEEAAATPADIDPETAGRLAEQLALTAPIAAEYPTLGDALDAGLLRQGPFSPGLGLHVSGPGGYSINADGDMDPEDIASPTLIYDGIERDSALAGFMYMAYQETEPEGFVGDLDRWHYHTAVCIVMGPNGIETPFGADLTGVTDAMCEAEGGRMIDFTGYMVHVWTVPGYESELGTFSDLNPAITCPDGTYYTIPTDEIGDAGTTCLNA